MDLTVEEANQELVQIENWMKEFANLQQVAQTNVQRSLFLKGFLAGQEAASRVGQDQVDPDVAPLDNSKIKPEVSPVKKKVAKKVPVARAPVKK